MMLYHGSNVEIEEIDLTKCKPYKDFGSGFYLTTIKEQAIRMAENKTAVYGGTPIVTIYEADDAVAATIRRFLGEKLDEEGLKKRLTYKELSNQYSFHTEKAIAYLRKVGVLSE